MHYTIYKITIKVTNKIYIGKHQTKNLNDRYMGSGKMITNAIKKHGKDSFEKEILFNFTSEEEMNSKEAELVTEEFCLREDTYNLCPGGRGGWGYVNDIDPSLRDKGHTKEMYRQIGLQNKKRKNPRFRELSIQRHKDGKVKYNNMLGKKHSQESKDKIGSANSIHQTGSNNCQFGSRWFYCLITDKPIKVKKDSSPPENCVEGRKKPQ